MAKKRKPRQPDPNVMAFNMIERIAAKTEGRAMPEPPSKKNPAAVALGRLGGLKGGAARAKSLSERRRRAIAKRAAKARWSKEASE